MRRLARVDVSYLDDPARDVFSNRTLNLRSVAAIGYDMDYTLIHYRTEEWERVAFGHAVGVLARHGWSVDGLAFDPDDHLQGLVVDVATGNICKATRFGAVVQAHHGTRPLSFDEVRTEYSGVFVDLADARWRFLNTMFSLSEASLFAQLVDQVDAGEAPGVFGYDDVDTAVRSALDEIHSQGALKAEIVADPDRFVVRDGAEAATLLDQRAAGKRLVLITNSDWAYTRSMMSWCFDEASPTGSWRDLFDLVVVSASKPSFFAHDAPAFAIVDHEHGWLEPHRGPFQLGGLYHGGCARAVEATFDLTGDQILYVGDHLFGDVHASKATLRWRTALILRELEDEILAAIAFAPDEARLSELMAAKIELEDRIARARLERMRAVDPTEAAAHRDVIDSALATVRDLDAEIAPLASQASRLGHRVWGPLMRAGNDKSLFARQVEQYADLYTSRVSNLGRRTPFAYLRASRTSLPHDGAVTPRHLS